MAVKLQIKCDICSHWPVCLFKADMVKVQRTVNGVVDQFKDEQWIVPVTVDCKYYQSRKCES